MKSTVKKFVAFIATLAFFFTMLPAFALAQADLPMGLLWTDKEIGSSTMTMDLGETYQLQASIMPRRPSWNTPIVYASSNSNVVTVSHNGLLTAVAYGSANVTATISGDGYRYTATRYVSVQNPNPPVRATDISLNVNYLELVPGETSRITAVVYPANASQEVDYIVGSPSIATVDANGYVKALKPGVTSVTVQSPYGGTTYTISITVKDAAPTSLQLHTSNLQLKEGDAKMLSAFVKPGGASYNITWSTSNAAVASVSKDGLVSGLRQGTATITATTSNGLKAQCTVVVSGSAAKKQAYIELSASTLTLKLGQTEQLQSKVIPLSDPQGVKYSSSNPSIARVDSEGRVTGLKKGTAIITASQHGLTSVTCRVTVLGESLHAAPTAITLDQKTLTMAVGDQTALKPTLQPANATAKFTYSSSKPSVASISASGAIQAKAPGKATITVKTDNGRRAQCVVTVVKKATAPTGIYFETGKKQMRVGETATLGVTILPAGAETSIRYASSDTAIATVNSSGKVVAKKQGTVTITATTDNQLTARCVLDIIPKVSQYADEVIRLVNEERKKAGLSELKKDDDLQRAADIRAKELIELFSHDRPDGSDYWTVLKEVGITGKASGENIAAFSATPESVMNAWMNSSGHRQNILWSNYRYIGVGYANGYWVQLFIN